MRGTLGRCVSVQTHAHAVSSRVSVSVCFSLLAIATYACVFAHVCVWMFLFCSTLNCTRIGRHHFQRLLCESGSNSIFSWFCLFQKISTLEKRIVVTRVIVFIIINAFEALATSI